MGAVKLKLPQPDGADALAWQLRAAGITGFEREARFHAARLWRADVLFKAKRLAVEVDGFGIGGTAGRHQQVGGMLRDCEKYCELAIAGYRLIRVTTKHVRNGMALAWIERALK